MTDLTRTDFAKVNKEYDEFFSINWPAVPCRRWEYVAAVVFSQILGADTDSRVCDAGSGSSSAFTRYLANKGFCVDAFDRGIAGSQAFASGGNIFYHDMDMIDIKFDDYTFNYVFAMSSIEHVNAGKFSIPDLEGDVGDTAAMLELCRILKPGGVLVLTTDYAFNYIKPPGPYGTHRVYNWSSLLLRLVNPAVRMYNMTIWGGFSEQVNWHKIKKIEPLGWDYTEFILTLRKAK